MAEGFSLLNRFNNRLSRYIEVSYDPNKNMLHSKKRSSLKECKSDTFLNYVYDSTNNIKEPLTKQTSKKTKWNNIQKYVQYFILNGDELKEIKDTFMIKLRENYVLTITATKHKYYCKLFDGANGGKLVYQRESKSKQCEGFVMVFYHRTCTPKLTKKEKSKLQFVCGFGFNYN
mmetsp:Transcript_27847/g.24639  ORF Transcript_27847/g.24639 Transcript_27847/m.24639 type:complete len:174 (+) Transcript_27847:90-611(+)